MAGLGHDRGTYPIDGHDLALPQGAGPAAYAHGMVAAMAVDPPALTSTACECRGSWPTLRCAWTRCRLVALAEGLRALEGDAGLRGPLAHTGPARATFLSPGR